MATYFQGAVKSGDGFSETATGVRPTFSAAQLAAMDDIDGNTSVYATVTSVGQPTAGQVRVTVAYTGGAA